MRLSMAFAMAQNRVIGKDNALPWHLPKDLQYFKKITLGKPIIMGRKTFDSIGRPLPGRPNIVITRNTDWSHEGVQVVHSVDEAIALGSELANQKDVEELMVIGGSQIYTELLNRADRLYMTQVHSEVEGDDYFPAFSLDEWQKYSEEHHSADESNPYDYSFLVLDRRESKI